MSARSGVESAVSACPFVCRRLLLLLLLLHRLDRLLLVFPLLTVMLLLMVGEQFAKAGGIRAFLAPKGPGGDGSGPLAAATAFAAAALRPALGILEMADGEDFVGGPKMSEEGFFSQRQEGTVDALEDGRRRVDSGVARRRQFPR